MLTGFDHDASGFVSHDQWRYSPAGAAIKAVDVTAANSASLDLHQHIVGTDGRFFDVGNLHLLVISQQQGAHYLPTARRRRRSKRIEQPTGAVSATSGSVPLRTASTASLTKC